MKKLFLMLLLAIMGTKVSMAQTDLVATLSHSSNISTYYGANALSEAYTAAVDGDVITLSSGTFNAVDIEKAITLRGAGMYGLDNGAEPTIIQNGMSISASITTPHVTTIEGIRCQNAVSIIGTDLASVNIFKCKFLKGITCKNASVKLVHCIANVKISWYWYPLEIRDNSIVECINCVLGRPACYSQTTLENCVIIGADESSISTAQLRNCVLAWAGNLVLPTSVTANHNVCYNSGGSDCFSQVTGINNINVESMEELFKTYRKSDIGQADTNNTFELTETAAATYLGDDGKQVGIYGGTNPFDPTPTNPQIKKFTVDNSVNNGKLSVKINVE